MTRHDDLVRLKHMLEHASEAVQFTEGRSRDDLKRDRQLELVLTRLVEVVGEAAARVSHKLQQRHPQIPWPEIVALRNRLIHGYDAVDLDILWDIVTMDLPALIEALRGITEEA
ncbi:MAG: DUF86 domain-containing protein [Thermoguttaceae bacterium]|jgi:uncharacterized protein with HEPN domain|nr:DUF86 domain-containing protein [Thermoguttaceae bacterium]